MTDLLAFRMYRRFKGQLYYYHLIYNEHEMLRDWSFEAQGRCHHQIAKWGRLTTMTRRHLERRLAKRA